MQVEPQALVNDILTIVAGGATYVNTVTGEERTAVFLSDIAPTLTGSWSAGLTTAGISKWKNVSHINGGDLEDSGFTLLVREDNPNSGKHGDWRIKYSDGTTGRRMGKYQTLVTL